MSEHAAWAIIIASIAGCTAGQSYFNYKARKEMTPQQICVERSWSQKDRLECLKTK